MSTMSREERVKEIIKCGQDPIHFINTYVKIQHPTRGTIPFETYDFQDDVLKALEEHRLNIVLKSRQLGLSTIAAAYATWLAIFHKDKNILIIATKKDTATNMIKKIKVMIKSLPEWLLMPTYEETQTSLRFSNGSEIKSIPTSPDAGRSEALSFLIIDEAAFIRDFEEIWTGLYPTISTGGRALILSTPNGVGGVYYRLWTEGEAGQNQFNTIRLPWFVHPEHDQHWFDEESKGFPKRKVAQEFMCDFIASGDTFLQPDVLEVLRDGILAPTEKVGPGRNVWIWNRPIPEHRYVISADVARGDAADYSTFHVLDADTSDCVAEYMGKVPPEVLAELMMEYGHLYNTALLAPENNSFGYSTVSTLKKAGYPRLYWQHAKGDPFTHIPQQQNDDLPGFSTQGKSRVQILTNLEELLRNKLLRIPSQRLYDQLQAFIWEGSKPKAMKDSHDDLIMSLAIGGWIVGGATGINERDQAMAIAMLKATHLERRSTAQMPTLNEVQPLIDPHIRGITANTVGRARDAALIKHGDASDFSWLLR
jgi:hypothetical protein